MLVAQPCQTLCDPMDCSPLGSSVHGSFQAIILEWSLFPSPGELPDPGIKLWSPALQAVLYNWATTEALKERGNRQISYATTTMWNLQSDTNQLIYKTDLQT